MSDFRYCWTNTSRLLEEKNLPFNNMNFWYYVSSMSKSTERGRLKTAACHLKPYVLLPLWCGKFRKHYLCSVVSVPRFFLLCDIVHLHLQQHGASRARSRIKFVIHFMYIDCIYILVKKSKTTHRKLMSSWTITLLGNTISKLFTWFWIFFIAHFVRPWQIGQKMATVSLPLPLPHSVSYPFGLCIFSTFCDHWIRRYAQLCQSTGNKVSKIRVSKMAGGRKWKKK
jgi:hypothetical protein